MNSGSDKLWEGVPGGCHSGRIVALASLDPADLRDLQVTVDGARACIWFESQADHLKWLAEHPVNTA